MLIIIGIFLSIIIPVIVYRYVLKGQAVTSKKLFIKTFILGATLYTIPIIILEVLWDMIFKGNLGSPLAESLGFTFFRAALLEEAVKYFFTYMILKKHKELGLKEAILLAGIVGISYGFTEKLVYGGAAMIVSALAPGHMLFQWIMGYYIYKALRAEGGEKRKLFSFAYIIPFLIHGAWDFCLDLGNLMPDLGENTWIYELVLNLAVFVVIGVMIAVTVKAAKMIRKIGE